MAQRYGVLPSELMTLDAGEIALCYEVLVEATAQ